MDKSNLKKIKNIYLDTNEIKDGYETGLILETDGGLLYRGYSTDAITQFELVTDDD